MNYVLFAWVFLGGLIGGFIQYILAMYNKDELSLSDAFYFSTSLHETYSDEINCAGLIIAIAFITVLTLPGSVLIVAIFMLKKLILAIWDSYKYIFKKRKVGEGMMGEERCVCCGAIIPEGRQVCPACNRKTNRDHFVGYIIKDSIKYVISGTLKEVAKRMGEPGVTEAHAWVEE